MYAQKRRLKQFHDSHIVNKRFQKGDLVLAYTLKQHTSKLKKRGMGPYLIHDLSSSGAVHLATLDGVPMANWISGCRLKKYKEPLTEDILKRLHATKERKRRDDKMKAQAQREAKERAVKLRKQRLGITNQTRIQVLKASESTTQTLKPYILVEIGKKQETEMALIDTGADVNAISHETWVGLGKPQLTPSTLKIDTFSGSSIAVDGTFNLSVFIGTTDVRAEFVVMKTGMMTTPIILGQAWQRQYNTATNWQEEGLNFEVAGNKYFTPFFNEETSSQSETTEVQGQENEATEKLPTTKTTQKTNRKGEQWKWVPKIKPTKPIQQPKLPRRDIKRPTHKTHFTQRWVPKTLLKAQGFYDGAEQVWLPNRKAETSPQPSLSNTQGVASPRLTQAKKVQKEWRVKPNTKTRQQTLSNKPTATPIHHSTTCKWIPKKIAETQTPTQSKSTKVQPSLIMQIKIRHLQVLLFGAKSLSLPYEWPTPLTLSLLYN